MKIHTKDYCAAPDELAKNPDAFASMVRVANGNPDALRFMWVFWCFEHCYDDLVDRDKPVPADVAARALAMLLTELTYNPFWLRNSGTLHAFTIQALSLWMTGEIAEREGSPDGAALRCGDIDLFLHIAFLCGGYDHMMSVADIRTFDPSPTKEE